MRIRCSTYGYGRITASAAPRVAPSAATLRTKQQYTHSLSGVSNLFV